MNQETGITGYEEERVLLKRYLSDEIAPMIFANSAAELFEVPAVVVAQEIQSWIGDQIRGASNMTAGDLIFHAATKLHQLGILELIPRDDVGQFLTTLKPQLLNLCPVDQRPSLDANFSHLEKSTSLAGSSTEVLHKPVGPGGGGYGAAPAAGGVPGALGVPGGAPGAVPQTADPVAMQRLNLLLDRLQQSPALRSPSESDGQAGDPSVLAHIIDEVASRAGSSRELETQLDFLKEMGVAELGDGLIEKLGKSLPDWAPPPPGAVAGAEPPAGAARAMRKVVKLSKDPEELAQRFRELVSVAVDEFNKSALGRSVTMLDLAQRMIEQGEIAAPIAHNVFDESAPKLDPEQLDMLAEDPDHRLLLRRILQFFPQYHAERLLEQLLKEVDRERRLHLLKLLRAHGASAREEAVHALDESINGDSRQPVDFERNLLYLIRAIPSTSDETLDHEIDLLNQTSDLREPLPIVRESFSALVQARHPRAYAILAARINEIEGGLTATASIPLDAKESRLLLSNTIKRLCQDPDNDSLELVITHGLKGTPQLGDTYSRLAILGSKDLSEFPEQIVRLTDAIDNELPRKFLGMSVGNQRKALILEPLVAAISGTRTPVVRRLLNEIAEKYANQPYGEKAIEALKRLGRPVAAATPTDDDAITLSGDLGLFGLPNLLQNLADNGVTGTVKIETGDGKPEATIDFADGEMVAAACGKLSDEVAVYQLLERPMEGRFRFADASGSDETHPNAANARSVMSLLMEGMRRFDEFNRARALVADDATFKASGKKASDVKEDGDPALAKEVWARAARGASPATVEAEIALDAFRVRRLYEHWVTEGSLVAAEETPTGA